MLVAVVRVVLVRAPVHDLSTTIAGLPDAVAAVCAPVQYAPALQG